jgi:hypothetical protein
MTNTVQASDVAAVIDKIVAAWKNTWKFRRVDWPIISSPRVSAIPTGYSSSGAGVLFYSKSRCGLPGSTLATANFAAGSEARSRSARGAYHYPEAHPDGTAWPTRCQRAELTTRFSRRQK